MKKEHGMVIDVLDIKYIQMVKNAMVVPTVKNNTHVKYFIMKIELTEVTGWKAAIRGMRNPMDSWDKSDSGIHWPNNEFTIGPIDNELAKKLIKAGKEHRKFLRLIHISCDITIPRYIWQELDTYKVGTVRMSCGTMHRLGYKSLTPEDFQDNHILSETLECLNHVGELYRKDKLLEHLRFMKQILPENFLQKATYDMNYETAMNMYHQRKDHRMVEWSGEEGICEWIKSLPMMDEWLLL
jgi:hypothetical protein